MRISRALLDYRELGPFTLVGRRRLRRVPHVGTDGDGVRGALRAAGHFRHGRPRASRGSLRRLSHVDRWRFPALVTARPRPPLERCGETSNVTIAPSLNGTRGIAGPSSCWPGSALLPALAINARIKHSSLRVAEASERLPTPPSTRSRTVPTYLWGSLTNHGRRRRAPSSRRNARRTTLELSRENDGTRPWIRSSTRSAGTGKYQKK